MPAPIRGRPQGRFTQHHRMRELRQLLLRHPKGVTVAQVAAQLKVTTRSARRYLHELRLELESVADQPSGAKRWRIPQVDLPRHAKLRRAQAYALLAARGVFEPIAGSALHEEIQLATDELLAVARRPGRGPNAGVDADAALEDRFRYLPYAPKDYREHGEVFDSVFQAVADRRPLKVRCADPDTGKPSPLKLLPYALVIYKDAFHCLAAQSTDPHIKSYELDELLHPRCLEDERFDVPSDFRVEDYLQGQFGLWRNEGETTEVILELSPFVADYVRRRHVHPSAKLEAIEDGGVRLSLQLGDLSQISSWSLSFGAHARVIAPRELKDGIREKLAAALAHYE